MSTAVDASRPTIFLLHALGMSAREFDGVAARLADTGDVVALDLPGFGDASAASGVTVDDMAALVVRKVRRHAPGRWLLVGHSMGGKVASVVASRALGLARPDVPRREAAGWEGGQPCVRSVGGAS